MKRIAGLDDLAGRRTVAQATGRPVRWRALPSAVLAALTALGLLSGCSVSSGLEAVAGADSQTSNAPAQTVSGPSGSALKALATIPVKGRAPTTGYTREKFGAAWSDTDHNGCDQRDDILRRDLTGETLKAGTHGCVVLSGTLADPYTGKTIVFRKANASAIQIDHMVALQNAWVTGAFQWTAAKRMALATDPLNLMAVDGPTNESKGSGDAATWLPRASFRCAYVARQVAVKEKYGAWMTAAEHQAIANILSTCPGQKLPQVTIIPLGDGATAASGTSSTSTSRSQPATSSPKPAASSGQTVVSPGAFCSPEGATGVTSAGTAMICSSVSGARARWRSS